MTVSASHYSMTELEKDIGNLRSGLKSVESVSCHELFTYCVNPPEFVSLFLTFLSSISTCRNWNTRRSDHRSWATSLCQWWASSSLWPASASQTWRTLSLRPENWLVLVAVRVCICVFVWVERRPAQSLVDTGCWTLASHFFFVQLFLCTALTSSVTFLGKLTAGAKHYSFLLQDHWLFIGQPANCHVCRSKVNPGTEP